MLYERAQKIIPQIKSQLVLPQLLTPWPVWAGLVPSNTIPSAKYLPCTEKGNLISSAHSRLWFRGAQTHGRKEQQKSEIQLPPVSVNTIFWDETLRIKSVKDYSQYRYKFNREYWKSDVKSRLLPCKPYVLTFHSFREKKGHWLQNHSCNHATHSLLLSVKATKTRSERKAERHSSEFQHWESQHTQCRRKPTKSASPCPQHSGVLIPQV